MPSQRDPTPPYRDRVTAKLELYIAMLELNIFILWHLSARNIFSFWHSMHVLRVHSHGMTFLFIYTTAVK